MTALVELDREHPGFRDAAYRTRRDAIARLALAWRGGPAPRVVYTDEEHAVWSHARERLASLHRERAARPLLEAAARLGLSREEIPQLADVSQRIEALTGFRLAPVAGLIAPRDFLAALADGVFLATQYVRHASAPDYTPEPDVIHELVGHAASLTCPAVAAASRAIGAAAREVDELELRVLERLYWRSLEFGVVLEEGQLRAVGAGLLSSAGELERLADAPRAAWSVEAAVAEGYDPTRYQARYLVAASLDALLDDVARRARDGPP